MPNSESAPFIHALMDRILDGTMIPKVQTEREVGPILDLFLADALTEALRDDPQLSGPITTVCREFPFKKPGNSQSTNIDWLMLNEERGQLIFVELKTADTSVNGEQSRLYRAKQEAVRSQGAVFLLDDLRQLRDVSGERGKYDHVLTNAVEPRRDAFAACRDAVIVYLVPASAARKVSEHADKVITFSDLPVALPGPFADEWAVIRPYLCRLDESSRAARNEGSRGRARAAGSAAPADVPRAPKWQGTRDFRGMMSLCVAQGDAVVVGFTGGREAFAGTPLADLRRRPAYKWDFTHNMAGKRRSDWLLGSEVVELLARCHGYPGESG